MYRNIPCNELGLHLQLLILGRGHVFLGKAHVPTYKSRSTASAPEGGLMFSIWPEQEWSWV